MSNRSIKFDKVLLYSISGIVLFIGIYLFYQHGSDTGSKEVGYVDIGRLVEGYKLKKDLENVSSQNLYKIKEVVDSLEMLKKVSGTQPNGELDKQLENAQYAFQQYYAKTNQEINKKIWERLNPVLEEYGSQRHLQMLIGANGAGTLLYADKSRDYTEDLIKYANEKYEKAH